MVLTTSPDLISDINALKNRSISTASDHIPISFSLNCFSSKSNSNRNHTFPLFSKGDYFGMNEHLLSVNIDFYFTCTDIEFLWSFLKQTIYEAISIFVPISKSKAHPHPRWFTPELRHQLNKLHTLRRKYKKLQFKNKQQQHLSSAILEAESCFQNHVANVKVLYESKLICDYAHNSNQKIFNYIRSIRRQASIPHTVFFDDRFSTNDHDKANLFNEFFQSVFKSSNIPPLDSSSLPIPPISLDNISITEADVYITLTNLDETKATGPDGIPTRVLKHCSCVLASPIKHLFSQCILQSYLSKEWKIHQIVPIFKSGDRSSVKKYRPISLLCCTSKVLERIIYDKIYNSLIKRSFLSSNLAS